MTFSALTGLNLNNLHPYEAAHFAALFRFKTEQNGLLDPAHQLVQALCLGMAAGKLRDRGNIIAIFVLSYYYIESH